MNLQITPTFQRTYKSDKRIICYRGGTRSGKSFALMQKVALWLWTSKISGKTISKGTFSVTRSTMPALRATVLSDFITYLFEMGIYQFVEHRRTVNEFSFQGRKVTFFSLDDEHKLRGRQHSFLWINECTDTSWDIFNQGVFRLDYQMFLDYNPQGEPWVKTEIEEKRLTEKKDVHLDISVYTDNPFLSPLLVDEIRHLENVDNDLFRIYTLGEWVSLKGLIYPNVNIIDEIPLVGKVYFGMDFGYNDPNVLVKVCISGDNMYIDTLIYERNMVLDDMAQAMKKVLKHNDVVYCDYSEPRTIEELKRAKIRAKKTLSKDVLRAIVFIKRHNLFVTSRSVETLKEWQMFKWEQDKLGRLLDRPINMFKHSSDAVSYAISKAYGTKIELL